VRFTLLPAYSENSRGILLGFYGKPFACRAGDMLILSDSLQELIDILILGILIFWVLSAVFGWFEKK